MFRKFQDSSGQTLQAVLSARGETAESYISRIAFLQGFEAGRCGENGVVAMTTLGTPVVWLCGRKFAAVARRDLSTGAVVPLHEELHTLGLGEDPPTSQEISRLVETSCR